MSTSIEATVTCQRCEKTWTVVTKSIWDPELAAHDCLPRPEPEIAFTVGWPPEREEVNAMPKPSSHAWERCGSCGGVINPQTGECRCSD